VALTGYRIAFAASIMAFVGASLISSLQARNLRQWNIARIAQPVLSFMGIATLWRLHVLTVDTALVVLAGTMPLQSALAYGYCRRAGLVPGHTQMALVRPLAAYGAAQIAALTPAALNAQLDQLVLSQTVPAADLGRYAVAVSLSLFPIPLVSAIGNVAFPRLAAQSEMTQASQRLQKASVAGSFVVSAGLIFPFAAVAYWVVPLVFGSAYREAVPLLWILAPGSVFLACGQVVGDLLRGKRQPGAVAWAQGLAAVFTVVLLLALLPFVGVYGAAIASTVAYGIALAAMLRCLRQPPRHARRSAAEAIPAAD
jgi:O-antigen/teichoic acid export membrane protein